MNTLLMTPLDTLLKEIYEIDPSFTVVWDDNKKKTIGICLYNAVFEEESLSKLIIVVWLYYFKERIQDGR